MKRTHQSGVTIIARFTGIVYSKLNGHADNARIVAARVRIDSFEQALAEHKLALGVHPTASQGLEAIRPHLNRGVPLDPWHRPCIYATLARAATSRISFLMEPTDSRAAKPSTRTS